MKNAALIASAPLVCIVATASGATINDLAGPSDYGATVQPIRFDLGGVVPGDFRQYQCNNCYFWAPLISIAIQNPAYLSHLYEVEGDGTVDVTFYRNGLPVIINVTPAINTWYGDPNSGYDGANGDAAGEIIEKAFAYIRNPAVNTMADENWGLPSEVMSDFGLTSGFLPTSIAAIQGALAKGDIVDFDTGYIVPAGAVQDHSYTVVSVDAAAGTALARSPWGDGYAGYDEYITVNDAWLKEYTVGVFYGQFGGDAPAPAPEPASLAMLGVGIGLLLRRRAHGV